jgi:uncharacterized LabA/DUF88 family protein
MQGAALRTIVYVDGFNLYYGCIKGTAYKWLDLCELFRTTLPAGYQLEKVKYFTARVSALPNDPLAPNRQNAYLRALRAHCKQRIQIHEGHFSVKKLWMPQANNPAQFVEVIRSEEKGSDVNLAVQLVNDSWEDAFDAAAVVSNDGDLERALQICKQKHKKNIVLYTPGAPTSRKPLAALSRWADKQVHITSAHMAASQLPSPIPGTPLTKPIGW